MAEFHQHCQDTIYACLTKYSLQQHLVCLKAISSFCWTPSSSILLMWLLKCRQTGGGQSFHCVWKHFWYTSGGSVTVLQQILKILNCLGPRGTRSWSTSGASCDFNRHLMGSCLKEFSSIYIKAPFWTGIFKQWEKRDTTWNGMTNSGKGSDQSPFLQDSL